jgi:hypothetical protein
MFDALPVGGRSLTQFAERAALANGKCREPLARRHNPAMKKGRESGGGRKASEAFVEFAQPLLETSRGPLERDGQAQMLTLAFAVWNAVVFERAGRRPRVLEGLRAALSGPAEREILQFLVNRKRSERPIDNRVVGDLQFVPGKGGEVGVRVSYAEYSLVADDPKLERIEAHILDGFGAPKGPRGKSGEPGKGKKRAKASKAPVESEPTSKRGAETSSQADSERDAEGDESIAGQSAERVAAPIDAKEALAWRALFERANELRELAPWNWMSDSELFGVRLAGESIVRWCCVMGAAVELFGLAVYDGDEGFDAYQQIQNNESDNEEPLYGSDGLLVTFGERESLSPLEVVRAKAAKVSFKGAKAWPQVEITRAGRLPQAIDAEHVARVTELLERALAIVSERREKPELLAVGPDGALPVWSAAGGVARVERVKPQPPAGIEFPAVDELGVKRLAANAERVADTLEYDIYPTQARVDDGAGGAYIPAVLALVDAVSGVAHCCEIVAPELRHVRAAQQLLVTFAGLARIPREVRVSRAWVREAVKPTLDALGVRTSFADELPMLEEFRWSMEDALEQGELGG